MPSLPVNGKPLQTVDPQHVTRQSPHVVDPQHVTSRPPHVVIIGGGFAGISAARALAKAPVRITLLDRTNHHLFQPLLYQVATAVLNPADISVPIRWILRKQKNVTVLMANVSQIDPHKRTVSIDNVANHSSANSALNSAPNSAQSDSAESTPHNTTELLQYDYLIIAAGARHAYFGHPEWEKDAPGLKSISDALEMRSRFLTSFERAERENDEYEREALLTFVIVGGGPTGVELAGMIPEVAGRALVGEFRRIEPNKARVVLIEGGPRLLPAFPEKLSARARKDLESLGVEVRTGCIVTSVDESGVVADGERISARTVFWGAGNRASPLTQQLDVKLDRSGRVEVNPDLSVPGYPNIFCAGDVAAAAAAATAAAVTGIAGTTAKDGKSTAGTASPALMTPAVAAAANQMGTLAGANIAKLVAGSSTKPFKYRNKGDLATIGRHRAVAVIGGVRLSGTFAWVTWLFVHILYLIGVRNRLSVMMQWAYQYFTFQRGVRLISGEIHEVSKS